MLWLVPTILMACIATFFLGYHYRNLVNRVEELGEMVKSKVDGRDEIETPRSEVIDPMDEIQTAMYEHKKMMEKLNPDE